MLGCVMTLCTRAGTDSVEKLTVKWLIHVSTGNIVVRYTLAGSVEHALKWLMGLFNAKCVSMIIGAAVILKLTSVFVTVGCFTFINLTDSMFGAIVTVATGLYLQHQVGRFIVNLNCALLR